MIQEPEIQEKPKHRILASIGSVLNGSILLGKETRRVYKILVQIIIIALIYISNDYSMYKRYREQSILRREIKELRTKSVTFSSEVIKKTKQSNIEKELNKRGIDVHPSRTPHKILD